MSLSSIIGQASRGADLYFVFRFLRLLTMDYKKTDAYKFKIIDSKGKALRKSADLESTKEKAAYTMLHRMVFKIRRLMEKVPGGRFVNYAAALFLLKEQKDVRIWTDDIYMKTKLLEFLETDWEADAKFLKEEVDNMDKKTFKSFLTENQDIEESQELQALMALDDAGIEAVIDKKGRIVVKKKDIKKAEKALSKSFKRGGEPDLYHEEVDIEEIVARRGEAVNLKKLKKEYDKNEDKNYHTENYLLLAKAFGTPAEVKKVEEILKRNEKQGQTSKVDYDWMYKNINPYYKKLVQKEEVEINEISMEAGKVYQQDTHDGPIYFKAVEQQKNGKWKGFTLKRITHNSVKRASVDERQKWKATSDKDVPQGFDEEVEVAEAKGTAYPATIDTLRKIVKDKQHQTVMFDIGQALVDLFTASAMVQVYDALKPATKKKFEDMIKSKEGFMKSQAFAMKMIG